MATTIGHTTDDRRLSERVVDAIAEHDDVPADELDLVLYDAIDPDALDRLFNDTRGSLHFVVGDRDVLVTTEGRVEVTPRD